MNRNSLSLTARLLISATLLIIVALPAAALMTRVVLDRFMHAQIDRQLDAKIAQLGVALEAKPDGTITLHARSDDAPFDRPGSGWYWRVSGLPETISSASMGKVVLPELNPAPPPPSPLPPRSFLDSDRPSPPPPPAAEGAGPPLGPPAATDVLIEGKLLHVRLRHFAIAGHDVTIAATAPQEAVERPLREALSSVLLALGLAGLALILAILVQVRIGLRPLARLRNSVGDIRAGRTTMIQPNQPAEVRPLVEEINKLVKESELGLSRSRKHVSNLAHGLKTPLASLALALSTLKSDKAVEMEGLVAEMQKRIRHHLGRARMAALEGPSRSRTALEPRIRDICDAIEKIHADRQIHAEIACDSGLLLGCEASDTDEMLGNLIDNAFIWAARRVQVSAARSEKQIAIHIDDDGRGLAPDILQELATPGKRLDESVPGHGFGLAIVRELCELYGGRLLFAPSPLGGLRTSVFLPSAL